jgi:uncharacterized membrane protein
MSYVAESRLEQEESYRRPAKAQPNVGQKERALSAVAGGAILMGGLATRRLGLVSTAIGASLLYRGISGNCLAYRALGIDRSGRSQPEVGVAAKQGVHFDRSITIARPVADVFAYWRQLDNLPRLIDHLTSVTVIEGKRSHWIAQGPLGEAVEWDAEIFNERPDELIAWRSLPGSELDTAGSMHFQSLPHDRGTAVRLELKYDPPAGVFGAHVADWLGQDVEEELFEGLRRMKRLLETGETPRTEGQPQGHCSRHSNAGSTS